MVRANLRKAAGLNVTVENTFWVSFYQLVCFRDVHDRLGDYCEVLGSCLMNPCERGECLQLSPDKHSCSCPRGYEGARCEVWSFLKMAQWAPPICYWSIFRFLSIRAWITRKHRHVCVVTIIPISLEELLIYSHIHSFLFLFNQLANMGACGEVARGRPMVRPRPWPTSHPFPLGRWTGSRGAGDEALWRYIGCPPPPRHMHFAGGVQSPREVRQGMLSEYFVAGRQHVAISLPPAWCCHDGEGETIPQKR